MLRIIQHFTKTFLSVKNCPHIASALSKDFFSLLFILLFFLFFFILHNQASTFIKWQYARVNFLIFVCIAFYIFILENSAAWRSVLRRYAKPLPPAPPSSLKVFFCYRFFFLPRRCDVTLLTVFINNNF